MINYSDRSKPLPVDKETCLKAYEHVFQVKFEVFRDTVVEYLALEDQMLYNNPLSWDQIQLKTAGFIEQLEKNYA